MPRRITPLVTGEWYHLFNRSVQRQPIFTGKRNPEIFLEIVTYYTQQNPPVKFSYYRTNRGKYTLNFNDHLVTIGSYCIMPNHFHILARQEYDGGIRIFLQKTVNAYVHYFNLKHEQRGSLFESSFKAVHVESEEQLIHLSRYIHLNPVTAYLVENPLDYPFSSCNLFLTQKAALPFDSSPILGHFKKANDYLNFLMDQKDYQRELKSISHLTLETAVKMGNKN